VSHANQQTCLNELFAGKENAFSKTCEKRLKFNFISLSNTFFETQFQFENCKSVKKR